MAQAWLYVGMAVRMVRDDDFCFMCFWIVFLGFGFRTLAVMHVCFCLFTMSLPRSLVTPPTYLCL
jgi:hypothetical protein